MVPMSKAQRSAQPLDSPVPVGSLWVPEGFRVGKCLSRSLPTTSFKGSSSCLAPGQAVEGLVSGTRALGRHMGSRERKQPRPAGLPEVSRAGH